MIDTQMPSKMRANPSIKKSRAWTIVAIVLSVPILLILLFPVTASICESLEKAVRLSTQNEYMMMDVIVSFVLLCAFFFGILSIPKLYGKFIVLFCAIFMFLFWGVESEFFWRGLKPLYPAWYEVNMALNDIVAALFMIFLKKRTTMACTGSAINPASR